MLHLWFSKRFDTLASHCEGRKILVPSCVQKGYCSLRFSLSHYVASRGERMERVKYLYVNFFLLLFKCFTLLQQPFHKLYKLNLDQMMPIS
jgi:hypothetical protein